MTIKKRIEQLELMVKIQNQQIKELQYSVSELSQTLKGGVHHASNDSNE